MSKPNATGRSSGKWTSKEKKIFGTPKDEPWVWQTTELLFSPAWRSMSINLHKLIDFLIVEHRNHAGRENGNLKATYDQLVDYGLTRSKIKEALEEGDFLGLLRYDSGGRWAMTNQPSTYRLTFYAERDGVPATNEWKGRTQEQIDVRREEIKRRQKGKNNPIKNQNYSATSDTTVVAFRKLPAAQHAKSVK